MDDYIEYSNTWSRPIYEETINSLSHKSYDRKETLYGFTVYGFEFPSRPNYSDYLVIKYSGFSGKTLSVSSSTKIRYLPRDNKIELSKNNFG